MQKPALPHHDPSRQLRLKAMFASLIFGLLILFLKAYAAKISNSSALRSDALESTVNVLAAAFGLGSIIFADRPADADHPYGHGKIEYFAQAFEGGLISLAGFLILFDTISRALQGHTLAAVGDGLKLNLVAGALNGVLGIVLYRIGKRQRSPILVADGIHLLSDLATTLALAAGLGLALLTGWTWLDPLLAIGVSLLLFVTGFKLVQNSSNALLDAHDPDLINEIVEHLNAIPKGQVITAHELKAQQFGRDRHVDLHVVVPEFLSIKDAHDEAEMFAASLRSRLGNLSVVHTHIDPCERNYCRNCALEDCSIRSSVFHEVVPFNSTMIIEPGRN